MRMLVTVLALAMLAAEHPMAIARFDFHNSALLPASRVALRISGIQGPASFAVVGSGSVADGYYIAPRTQRPVSATLIAAGADALAMRTVHVVPPPRGPLIAVAAYDDGIVLHDARTFAMLGTLAIGGAPSDVAATPRGFVAADTDGTTLTAVGVAPWTVSVRSGILLGDALAADPRLRAIFVTERGGGGPGGLARVTGRTIASIATGTAEGIAIDSRRQLVYVADTDRGDVAVVDARRMRIVARINGVPRAFSLALSADGTRMYAVLNQGRRTILGGVGRVVEIALRARRIVARSAELSFPVGIAFDEEDGRVFVTDEQDDDVDVLDARTLRALRSPVATCSIPWQPAYDERANRLFVPCAGSDEVDVFDASKLSRVAGAPFRTGGYPLAVALSR
jgi:DNA-binding beta-propeller fold protein YncE